MTTDDALAALRAKLTPPYHPPEPIYDRLYDEYIRNADYDGWVPGGIGRVIEQMEIDTHPGHPWAVTENPYASDDPA